MIETVIESDSAVTDDQPRIHDPLWREDTGTLREDSRRALLELLKGPYLSGRANPRLWASLTADERVIRSRLHDVFLELVIDPVDEFAFVRKVRTTELAVPSALRSEALTFIDTALLLVLRQILLSASGEARVIVGRNEVYERLAVYRDGDESTFRRNLNGSWTRMVNRFRVLHTLDEERAEISPVVRFLVDADRVAELTAAYRAAALDGHDAGSGDGTRDGSAAGPDLADEADR